MMRYSRAKESVHLYPEHYHKYFEVLFLNKGMYMRSIADIIPHMEYIRNAYKNELGDIAT